MRNVWRLTAFDQDNGHYRTQDFFSNENAAKEAFKDLVNYYENSTNTFSRHLCKNQRMVGKINVCITKHNLMSRHSGYID